MPVQASERPLAEQTRKLLYKLSSPATTQRAKVISDRQLLGLSSDIALLISNYANAINYRLYVNEDMDTETIDKENALSAALIELSQFGKRIKSGANLIDLLDIMRRMASTFGLLGTAISYKTKENIGLSSKEHRQYIEALDPNIESKKEEYKKRNEKKKEQADKAAIEESKVIGTQKGLGSDNLPPNSENFIKYQNGSKSLNDEPYIIED